MKLKLIYFLIPMGFLLCSCQNGSKSSERIEFDSEAFNESANQHYQALGWQLRSFSRSSGSGGGRFITKFTHEEEVLYIFYETNMDPTAAYNLHIIGSIVPGDNHTNTFIEALRKDLPWLDEKAKFADDLRLFQKAIPTQHSN